MQVKAQTIDGQKYLLIPMEENEHINLNGVETTVFDFAVSQKNVEETIQIIKEIMSHIGTIEDYANHFEDSPVYYFLS